MSETFYISVLRLPNGGLETNYFCSMLGAAEHIEKALLEVPTLEHSHATVIELTFDDYDQPHASIAEDEE